MSTLCTGVASGGSGRRRLLRVGLVLAVVVGGLCLVRATVAEPFAVTTDAVAPEVPRGAHLIVSKLASDYAPGDIVAFRHGDRTYLARVAAVDPDTRQVTLTRNGEPNVQVAAADLVGRAVLNTR